MAKATVVHGPTNWRIGGLASCLEEITGKVIGVRWLLGAERRAGMTASSVVVYLDKEVFLGAEAKIKVAGKRFSMVPYWWRRAFVGEVVLCPVFLTPEVYRRVRRGAPETGVYAYLSFCLLRFGVVYT